MNPLYQEGWRFAPGCVVRAFSLVEVVIAVGLFALGITVMLALLPMLVRQGQESSDRLIAQRLPDAVQAELKRLAAGGFDALAGEAPVMGSPLDNGLALVATHDGARLQSRTYLPPTSGRIAEEEQYFLVECWQFPDGVLRYDGAQSSLALCVRVSWPYRVPGAPGPTALAARHDLMFTVSLNR